MAEITPGTGTEVRAGAAPGAAGSKPPSTMIIVEKTSAVVASDGSITITLGPVPMAKEWFIERIALGCTSVAACDAAVYEDIVSPVNRKDWTPAGNDDIADYNSPMHLAGGHQLIIQWTDSDLVDALGVPVIGFCNVQIKEVG